MTDITRHMENIMRSGEQHAIGHAMFPLILTVVSNSAALSRLMVTDIRRAVAAAVAVRVTNIVKRSNRDLRRLIGGANCKTSAAAAALSTFRWLEDVC